MSEITETQYRELVREAFDRIENAFAEVDPDVVECERAAGALTLSFQGVARCVLSAQPSLRQLWLAVASRGTAYHFECDPSSGHWRDGKGSGIELYSFLRAHVRELSGLDVEFTRN